MSGDGKEEPRSPPGSRPASVLQHEENSDNNVGAAAGANAGGGGGGGAAAGDYSNVAQRTVANIRRLQDNVCGQYVVQSRHVSTSGAAAAAGATCQYEQASRAG